MTGPAFESQPRYSPDGTEIVFVSDRSGGTEPLGAGRGRVGHDADHARNGNLYTSPEWAPDGEYLVASRTFSRWVGRPGRGSTTAGAGAGWR